jgi:hypothetical protein
VLREDTTAMKATPLHRRTNDQANDDLRAMERGGG